MRFRKKIEYIDAIQWTGDDITAVQEFIGGPIPWRPMQKELYIDTMSGPRIAGVSDWIIRNRNKFCVCAADVFEDIYEATE